MANIPNTLSCADAEPDYYPCGGSTHPYVPNYSEVASQYPRDMYQEDKVVSPTSMFRGSTDVKPYPLYYTQPTAIPGASIWIDWQFWMFPDNFGYRQGSHSSTDARGLPHNPLAAASTSMRDYPFATPATVGGVALNHPPPVATGVIDKASAMASTLIGGVAESPYPLAAPMTPPPSVGNPPVGVGYMNNSGRAIVATEDETPVVAGGHAPVASGEVAHPRQHQVQGAPVTRSVEVLKMEKRLLGEGVERTIVDRCIEIFKQGVTIDALEAQMTLEESEEYGAVGKKFRQLLEMAGEEGTRITHQCRLCRSKVYKNHRDGLRHLLKSHFRIGYSCEW